MSEYIEREAVHRMMVGLTRYKWTSPVSNESHVTVDADDVNFAVDKLPVADVAPVLHGRWEWNQRSAEWGYPYLCSQCGKAHNHEEPYCPNCGAKMDLDYEI